MRFNVNNVADKHHVASCNNTSAWFQAAVD
jgi:hypothetical protein